MDVEIITPHNIGGFDGVQHFSEEGYQDYAAKLYRLVERDFYSGTDTIDINPPHIVQAYFTDNNKNVLILEFDNTNPLTFNSDTTIGLDTYFLKDHFYFHNNNGTIDTGFVSNITV
ncbi:MAG: hypothetical protein GWN00_17330, partial [Aliifodinibius sp.]|nr:hypothetical protein [Fodinibius sp.]NIV12775.1 hypothetical protein [Fodinibius sp.]NIY26498.1 hypothetical protein [Fodinibius sp.]